MEALIYGSINGSSAPLISFLRNKRDLTAGEEVVAVSIFHHPFKTAIFNFRKCKIEQLILPSSILSM